MAEVQVSLSKECLANLLGDGEGLKRLLTEALNQVLEAELAEQIGAERYERSEARTTYRNGVRLRTLHTRVGPLTLRVPQTRDGAFSTEIFSRYQRSEQAFVLALMEMYVHGVSTRKVSHLTEALCGSSFSKSTVSQLCLGLDARVKAFRTRRFDGSEMPFLIVDAFYTKVRREHAIQRAALLIVSGINRDGMREVVGFAEGDSEAEVFWRELFRDLKARGLHGVQFVVSDDHAGLVSAVAREFVGAAWQRCQVHFLRNVLSCTPPTLKLDMAQALKGIFACDRIEDARTRASEVLQRFETRAPKACRCLENGLDEALQVMGLPEKYRRRLKSTNLQERLIREMRRRERVISIFPNPESAIRLVGALLVEQHELWQEKKYLDMTDYWLWRQQLEPPNHKKSTPQKVIKMG